MNSNNKNMIGVIVGVAGVLYGLYSQSKMNKIATRLNMAVNDLALESSIDIPRSIIKAATDQAIAREVSAIASQAALTVSKEITANINKEVKQSIDNQFDDLSEQVSNALSEQVSKIDTEALSNKITKKAEQKVLEKFDGVLDDVVGNFNKELKNVGKVYYSFTEALGRGEALKNTYFRR